MIDKKGILQSLPQNLVIELGCGPHKKHPSWLGIDAKDADGVDIVGDVFEVLPNLPDGCVAEIHAYHFFEHIVDVEGLLQILDRKLKPGGKLNIVVPHFSNPYFYSDPTHKRFFGIYSFSYFMEEKIWKHRVPCYYLLPGLYLRAAKLKFSSPFYINRPFRWLQQAMFNSSNLMKEWYEDSWSRTFPCYEIQFIIQKK